MSENTTKPTYEILPLDPEKNPPETIEEIEILIDKLRNKAVSIKQQLDILSIRERQGIEIDYTRVQRMLYAKAQTNRSIAALQRIVKNKRQQEALTAGTSFEKFFFESCKETLSADIFAKILDQTLTRMRASEREQTPEAS